MQENTKPNTPYYSTPDDAFWTSASEQSPITFCETQPAPDPDFEPAPKYSGKFKKGFDPRRHQFTQAERSRGFWTAIAVHGVGIGQKLHAAGRWPNYRGR